MAHLSLAHLSLALKVKKNVVVRHYNLLKLVTDIQLNNYSSFWLKIFLSWNNAVDEKNILNLGGDKQQIIEVMTWKLRFLKYWDDFPVMEKKFVFKNNVVF